MAAITIPIHVRIKKDDIDHKKTIHVARDYNISPENVDFQNKVEKVIRESHVIDEATFANRDYECIISTKFNM